MALVFKVARMHPLDGDGATKAFCDVCIGDEFLVKGFRVVEGRNGLFVSLPRGPGKDGKWYNSAFPVTAPARAALTEAVLSAYEAQIR